MAAYVVMCTVLLLLLNIRRKRARILHLCLDVYWSANVRLSSISSAAVTARRIGGVGDINISMNDDDTVL